MTIISDIAGDWQHIEGVEEVTFTPQNPAGAAIANVKALRRQLSRGAQFLGGAAGIEPTDVPWHLWKYGAAGAEKLTSVKPGDKITESGGTSWRIISFTFSPRTNRWQCICRQDS